MTLVVTHTFVSAIADGGDTTLVQPSNWNANHTLTGTLSVAQGGVGLTSYTIGDILYADSASTLAALADVATGKALISGGVGAAPSWGQIDLTTHVTGTLPIANGGTNATSLTSNAIDYFDGTSIASMAGTSWDNTNRSLTLTGATVTASKPILDLSQTWNSSGETFTALKLNTTITAATDGSRFFDFQIGGTSVLDIRTAVSNTKLSLNFAYSTVNSTLMTMGWTSASTFKFTWGDGFLVQFINGTTCQLDIETGKIWMGSAQGLGWGSSINGGTGTFDTILNRDAAGTIAQRNGTNAQTLNLYDTYSSSTDYHRVAIKTARATLTGVSGASVTATGIIPDGAVVVGVTSKVTTGLGTSNGTTGYQIGDGSDVDRWGAITGTAAGTSSDNTNWTATTIQAFTSASNIVVTASGGNFDGTGVIYLSVQYLIGQCD